CPQPRRPGDGAARGLGPRRRLDRLRAEPPPRHRSLSRPLNDARTRSAARKLLKGRYPLRTPADLAHHTILHDVFTVDWAIWLHSAGIDNVDPHRGPTFLSSDHAIQAAVRGEGVVLGRSALVADDLAAGRLVRPFELSLPADFAYYVVYPPRALKRPNVKAFREWLMDEIL